MASNNKWILFDNRKHFGLSLPNKHFLKTNNHTKKKKLRKADVIHTISCGEKKRWNYRCRRSYWRNIIGNYQETIADIVVDSTGPRLFQLHNNVRRPRFITNLYQEIELTIKGLFHQPFSSPGLLPTDSMAFLFG